MMAASGQFQVMADEFHDGMVYLCAWSFSYIVL